MQFAGEEKPISPTSDPKSPTGSELLCNLHSEKLRLFCLEDKQPVCVVCRDLKKHTKQDFRSIDEAAQDHTEELQTALKPLQETLDDLNIIEQTCDQTAEHIKERISQTQTTERQIREAFENHHQLLQDKEYAGITVLRVEKELQSQLMKQKIEKISREISSLSDTLGAIEDEPKSEDISFLQNPAHTAGSTPGLRSADRCGQTPGQHAVQSLGEYAGVCGIQFCDSGPQHCPSRSHVV
uniref:B box-type domain-containing protein n=1 Tax=Hucho hucho TaxID=62062 RepID=A0A4W5JIU0_9TELE